MATLVIDLLNSRHDTRTYENKGPRNIFFLPFIASLSQKTTGVGWRNESLLVLPLIFDLCGSRGHLRNRGRRTCNE